jgi:hypothetical protein
MLLSETIFLTPVFFAAAAIASLTRSAYARASLLVGLGGIMT